MKEPKSHSAESWERIYLSGGQNNVAPYTEVFSFLNRASQGKAPGGRLLEVGPGVGNNLVFARWAMGWEVYGIEGSADAVEKSKERFRRHGLDYAELALGTVPPIRHPDGFFDAVVDRATIQQNTLEAIRKIVKEVYRVLKPGGLFFSSMIAENHALFGRGQSLGNGDFDNPEADGIRHFFSRADVQDVFRDFELLAWSMVTKQNMLTNRVETGIFNIELRKANAEAG
jgi:SAM-dependent methyltransferase